MRPPLTLCIALPAILLSTHAVSAFAQHHSLATDQSSARRLAERFDSLRVASRIPGLAVVILRDTTVLLARGFGYADLERKVPVTPDTPFNIASVAKPISAVVALRLVERGLLDLNRPMNSFDGFSEFCAAAREGGGIFFGDYTCDARLTLKHVLAMSANGVPGTRFWYNPPSYSWASRPLAQVGQRPFSELTAALVFEPAGMTRSARIHRRLPLRTPLDTELAKPYHIDSVKALVLSEQPPPQGDGAAGGVISTANDLARFDIAVSSGRLVSPESRRLMWTPGHSPTGTVLPYGLGWFVREDTGERLVWHTGLWGGAYSALYLKAVDRRLTLILLANSDALQWPATLEEAAIERSPFATAFLAAFPR